MPARARSAARPGGSSREPMGKGVERGRRELNETRRRVGLPELARSATAGSAASSASSRRSRSSSIRAPGRTACTSPARSRGSRPPTEVELPPGEEPLVLIAPEHLAGPRGAAAARGAGRPCEACPCACSPPTTATRPDAKPLAQPLPAERAPGRLGLLLAGDAASRRRRVPRRATARSRVRSRRARAVVTVPAVGRHGRERRARPVGGGGTQPPARFLSPATLRWAVQAVLERPALRRAGPRARRLGRAERRRRRTPRRSSSDLLLELPDLEDLRPAVGADALDRRPAVLHRDLLRDPGSRPSSSP